MKKYILIAFLAFTLTLCLTTEKCKGQDMIDWVGNPASLGYGALYNWYAASNANFAPAGYHVPTDAEWTALITYLGNSTIAGGYMKESGLSHWLSPNTGADNSSGFNAKPGGSRGTSGSYYGIGLNGSYWTATATSSLYAYSQNLSNRNVTINRIENSKKYGFSVRLIKDNSTNEGDVTDYDGNVYHVTDINGQIWTTSNFKCTTLNNGVPIVNVTDNTAWSLLVTGAYCWYGNDIGNK